MQKKEKPPYAICADYGSEWKENGAKTKSTEHLSNVNGDRTVWRDAVVDFREHGYLNRLKSKTTVSICLIDSTKKCSEKIELIRCENGTRAHTMNERPETESAQFFLLRIHVIAIRSKSFRNHNQWSIFQHFTEREKNEVEKQYVLSQNAQINHSNLSINSFDGQPNGVGRM